MNDKLMENMRIKKICGSAFHVVGQNKKEGLGLREERRGERKKRGERRGHGLLIKTYGQRKVKIF